MRVVVAHPYRWPAVRRGGERYADDLVRWLRSAGHEAVVVARGPLGPGVRGVREVTGPVLRRLPWTSAWSDVDRFGPDAVGALLRRADVVHALVPTAAVTASLLGHRVVYTLLGEPTDEAAARSQGRGRLLRRAVRTADAITALSPSSVRAAERLFGRTPLVLPPGVDLAVFRPAVRDPRPTVLYSADLSVRRKGLAVLLAAAARVRRPGLRVVLSGPGDPGWAYDGLSAADRASLGPVVEHAGPGDPDEVPGRYAAAWVTALPAVEEAFGLVLVESLACGTPVLAGPGGAADVVTPATGRVADPADPAAVAAALDACLDLPRDVDACRAAAAAYGWAEVVGPAHVDLYATVRR